MDKFDALRHAGTEAPNHDLDTEDIIERLQTWDNDWGIQVLAAEHDYVRVRFDEAPADLDEFVNDELNAFCPDAVSAEGPQAVIDQIDDEGVVDLWWN